MYTTYKPGDRMDRLMSNEAEALRIISRFDLALGVGEQTIEEACEKANIHTATFLALVNYKIGAERDVNIAEISVPTLISYLRQSHHHFFEFSLPMLRRKLIEAVNYSAHDSKIPVLIMQYFDNYVNEISLHMEQENKEVFPYAEAIMQGKVPNTKNINEYAKHHHDVDDQNMADKLAELKKLIIRFYPASDSNPLMFSALYDLFLTEQDIATHCSIEDNILIPAIRMLEHNNKIKQLHSSEHNEEENETEPLSEREIDVLKKVVSGLSNKEIADELCISIHTVISHRKNITRKLNIHSTAGLTIYAIVNNIVDIESLR